MQLDPILWIGSFLCNYVQLIVLIFTWHFELYPLLHKVQSVRYDWQHGIQPRMWDPVIESRRQPEAVRVITHDTVPRGTRISLTFRKTRSGLCACEFKALCDVSGEKGEIDDDVASALEELHVHQVYEQIAAHFSRTRRAVWPGVARFLHGAPLGAVLLDLGAGNGKNVVPRPDLVQIACERSAGLAGECARRLRAGAGGAGAAGGADCVRLDVLRAPLRPACADLVLCVAVVHHFSSAARRREAIGTIARLLRAGGRALVTVWAREQEGAGYLRAGGERPAACPAACPTVRGLTLPVHQNRTQFRHSDLLVPWQLRGARGAPAAPATLLRYYHVFERGELEDLCRRPDLQLEDSFYEEGNWCVVVKKI